MRSKHIRSLACVLLCAAALAGCSDDADSPRLDGPAAAPDAGQQNPDLPLKPDAMPEPPDDPARPFALVELFTSEGCSSCPPGEKVFAQLLDEATKAKLRVFPVAWHVDYWDKLGWPDIFGSKAHSDRQRAYAKAWKSTKIYTPQMIINGAKVVPASNVQLAGKGIQEALAQPVTISATVWQAAPAMAGAELEARFKVKSPPAGADMVLVVVERNIVSAIKAGENAGKTLTHQNVARGFASAAAATSGKVTIKLPATLKVQESSLIGFVQDRTTLKVLAGTSAPLK